jgi:hypothetical protein
MRLAELQTMKNVVDLSGVPSFAVAKILEAV